MTLTLKKALFATAILAAASMLAVSAFPYIAKGVTSLPSSKAAVALGELVFLNADQSGPGDTDTEWQTVMQTYIKTPNGKDLHADVALQCGLMTQTIAKSKGGVIDTSTAQADIRVRVQATNTETGDVRYFAPDEGSAPGDMGVRYCDRLQTLSATFAGLGCTADLTTGVVTCTDPEAIELLQETLDANAFNFVLADVVSGVWKIEVQAMGEASVSLSGSALGDGAATAFVGLGSTVIETLRLVNGIDLGPVVELE